MMETLAERFFTPVEQRQIIRTVQRIWNDTLRPMFSNQTTIDAVQKVVDAGDLDALRQLFS